MIYDYDLFAQRGNDLSQRDSAVVRRHALMPIRRKPSACNRGTVRSVKITILKTAAAESTTRFSPTRLATATTASASAL